MPFAHCASWTTWHEWWKKTLPEIPNYHEVELLLCCVRVVSDDSATASMRSLAGAVKEWQLVLRFASRHRVKPLLYSSLLSHCADLVPDAIMRELREHFAHNTQRNLRLAGELIRLQRWFATEGVG